MEKISNSYRRIVWLVRRALNLKDQSVAPVVWRPALMDSGHLPSSSFQQNLCEDDRHRLEKIIEETRIISRLSARFPERLADRDWKILLECQNRKQRYDHLIFLHKVQRIRQEETRKKQEAANERSRIRTEQSLLFRPTRNEKTYEWMNVLKSFRLGAPVLAVDCQFIHHLSPRGRSLTASQLQYLYSENRFLQDPFILHFINFDSSNPTIKELMRKKALDDVFNSNRMLPIVSNECFSQIFNKDDVIYLSPDGEQCLETVEEGKVYVIGGIVDRVVEKGISKTASKDAAALAGVKCYKLPIDDYVEFKSGSKFLTLVAVMNILNDVHMHGDWKRAFERNIPIRNTKAPEEKNREIANHYKRIRRFNYEILNIVEKTIGPDNEYRRIEN